MPAGPLRLVVGNYEDDFGTFDRLECGHLVENRDSGPPSTSKDRTKTRKRRRCPYCAEEPPT